MPRHHIGFPASLARLIWLFFVVLLLPVLTHADTWRNNLAIVTPPRLVNNFGFEDGDNRSFALSQHRGKVVLLNFWAMWCEPCKREMEALSKLQTVFASEDLVVLPLAPAGSSIQEIERFYQQNYVNALPVLIDSGNAAVNEFHVHGLPMSIIIDRSGREVARIGFTDWYHRDLRGFLRSILAQQ